MEKILFLSLVSIGLSNFALAISAVVVRPAPAPAVSSRPGGSLIPRPGSPGEARSNSPKPRFEIRPEPLNLGKLTENAKAEISRTYGPAASAHFAGMVRNRFEAPATAPTTSAGGHSESSRRGIGLGPTEIIISNIKSQDKEQGSIDAVEGHKKELMGIYRNHLDASGRKAADFLATLVRQGKTALSEGGKMPAELQGLTPGEVNEIVAEIEAIHLEVLQAEAKLGREGLISDDLSKSFVEVQQMVLNALIKPTNPEDGTPVQVMRGIRGIMARANAQPLTAANAKNLLIWLQDRTNAHLKPGEKKLDNEAMCQFWWDCTPAYLRAVSKGCPL